VISSVSGPRAPVAGAGRSAKIRNRWFSSRRVIRECEMKVDRLHVLATVAGLIALGSCVGSAIGAPEDGSTPGAVPAAASEDSLVAGGFAASNSGPGKVLEISPAGGGSPGGEASLQAALAAVEDGDGVPSAVGSISEYMRQGENALLFPAERHGVEVLGIEAADGVDRVEGQELRGAEVLSVRPDSPAARAGLQSRRSAVATFLKTATFVGTLAFPPVGLLYDFVSDRGIGDRHDLIVGVDGERVYSAGELDYLLGRVREGEFVYLSVFRSGERLQIPVRTDAAAIR